MKVKYDRDEDILILELREREPIDHAEQVESLIMHFSEKDEPVLLEILHASDFLTQVLKSSLQPEAVEG
jgi:uncharacterized protein YuzE